MSRAIPSSFNEYLLDQSTRATGIICDGGIMPLRTNPDPTSLWFKNCIRGEDIMFLKEAISARRNVANNGIDKDIKADRLSAIRLGTGQEISSGMWTDSDPTSALGLHSFLQSMPSRDFLLAYVKSCLNPISQHSSGDTYTILDSGPIDNLFRDIKALNYVVCFPGEYSDYNGFTKTIANYDEIVSVVGHTDGTSTTTTTHQTTSYLWLDSDSVSYTHGAGYPNNLEASETVSTVTTTVSFSEVSGYRNYHRYMAMRPFAVVFVVNEYNAGWSWSSGRGGSDNHTDYAYILVPLPVSTYVDMLTNTGITLSNQAEWLQWCEDVYDFAGLQMNAADMQGEYVETDLTHWRSRSSRLSFERVFWVGHFLYCNLEGVTIQ